MSGKFNSYVRTAFISAPFTEVCFDLVFLSLSMQYIVLVIVVFVLQTIGGILAFTYREEVSYIQVDNMRMRKGGGTQALSHVPVT